MTRSTILAASLAVATIALVAIGTLHPIDAAAGYAGRQSLMQSASDPQAVAQSLGDSIRLQAWGKAYQSLNNRAQFTQAEFLTSLRGNSQSLMTYAAPQQTEVRPLSVSGTEATMRLNIYWATAVGALVSTHDIHLTRDGSQWTAAWPFVKPVVVPPQVIPVNYLRWDVINRGPGDDWGSQDVEGPHVRIVDMHPVQRADGVIVMGELLNEDVVPAFVSVTATLLGKDTNVIATEGCFDKISHLLLPKQVTPFLIDFPNLTLADVASIRMTPISALVSASADPVIEIADQHLALAPDLSLTGKLINQSGQTANVAHVLAAFYDKSGQLIWVADDYLKEALQLAVPVPFELRVPQDLATSIVSQRAVVATFSTVGLQ